MLLLQLVAIINNDRSTCLCTYRLLWNYVRLAAARRSAFVFPSSFRIKSATATQTWHAGRQADLTVLVAIDTKRISQRGAVNRNLAANFISLLQRQKVYLPNKRKTNTLSSQSQAGICSAQEEKSVGEFMIRRPTRLSLSFFRQKNNRTALPTNSALLSFCFSLRGHHLSFDLFLLFTYRTEAAEQFFTPAIHPHSRRRRCRSSARPATRHVVLPISTDRQADRSNLGRCQPAIRVGICSIRTKKRTYYVLQAVSEVTSRVEFCCLCTAPTDRRTDGRTAAVPS